MMENRLKIISDTLSNIENVLIKKALEELNGTVKGILSVTEENETIDFEVEIYSSYPFQINNSESIQFFNKNLKNFNHVNYNGSICIHNYKSPDLETKLNYDLISLKQWIKKYYIDKEADQHYEHIIVNEQVFNGSKFNFLFTTINHKFNKGDFGEFSYSLMSTNPAHENLLLTTFLITSFDFKESNYTCNWSNAYHNQDHQLAKGLFIFIEQPPVSNKRFIVENWIDLESMLDQSSFNFLKEHEEILKTNKSLFYFTPLLFGYKISEEEIHWQVAILRNNNFPIYLRNILFSDSYEIRFRDQKIIWGQTKNISYKYFFGRGKLHSKFTESNIAIIGLGAIGSVVANTLVRGGCKKLLLVDYDLKEPENVCRSEYLFSSGINKKVNELANELQSISPFVELTMNEHVVEIAKTAIEKKEWFNVFKNYFNDYNIIFDCTTDDDVAYLLDKAGFNGELINLSITNNAKELVCVVKPNVYEWLIKIFKNLETGELDLYNPTGCWNPTFKASYNDINVLIQFTLKQINTWFEKNMSLKSFYLSTEFDNKLSIKTNLF